MTGNLQRNSDFFENYMIFLSFYYKNNYFYINEKFILDKDWYFFYIWFPVFGWCYFRFDTTK